MSYATIEDLRSQLGSSPVVMTPEYTEKMMHRIPQTTEVDREEFILARCKNRRVLEFGASGQLHDGLTSVAAQLLGVDREAGDGVVAFDLDDVHRGGLPGFPNVEVIVCGEIIEHLSNPGHFLDRLKRIYDGIPVIVSVPNAFTKVARKHLAKGLENVNRDHVAWYSWKTLSTLLERAGFETHEFYWYGGNGIEAQGLVMVVQ